jgi:hypothetical protein
LIAAQQVFSNTEAARGHPAADSAGPAHDAYTRLLHRCQTDAEAVWQEVKRCVSLVGGILVVDDSTLDKFYARQIELVKHHRVVQGINLISLLWTDGEAHLPCDFRVYDKSPSENLISGKLRVRGGARWKRLLMRLMNLFVFPMKCGNGSSPCCLSRVLNLKADALATMTER